MVPTNQPRGGSTQTERRGRQRRKERRRRYGRTTGRSLGTCCLRLPSRSSWPTTARTCRCSGGQEPSETKSIVGKEVRYDETHHFVSSAGPTHDGDVGPPG